MAKSFHSILKEKVIEVKHVGDEIKLNLPEWLTECSEFLMDEEKMLAWAKDNELLLGLIHNGIQKTIIDLRAKARPSIKTVKDISDYDKEKMEEQGYIFDRGTVTKRITHDKEKAQERIDNFILKPTPAPGASVQGKVSKALEEQREKYRAAMLATGMSTEEVEKIINNMK